MFMRQATNYSRANLLGIKILMTSRDATTRVTCTGKLIRRGENARADSAKTRKRKREERLRSSSYTRYQTRVFRYGQQPPYLDFGLYPAL